MKPLRCTATTRPQEPFRGMRIEETDTGRVLVFVGRRWLEVAPGLPKEIDPWAVPVNATFTANTFTSAPGGIYDWFDRRPWLRGRRRAASGAGRRRGASGSGRTVPTTRLDAAGPHLRAAWRALIGHDDKDHAW